MDHTPTPWRVRAEVSENGKSCAIIGPSGAVIALIKNAAGKKEVNADFIVRACNSHDALLFAAKDALAFLDRQTPGIVLDCKDSLRIAIAKVEGK